MSKRKVDSKTFAQQRRRRRRLLTFIRMVRYGVNNFSRNAWLTIAATAVMTITLLIVFTTFAARDVLTNTVNSIRDKVDMTIYIDSEAKEKAVRDVADGVRNLDSVTSVKVITPDEARTQFIEDNKADATTLNSLNNSDPEFPWRLRIKVKDINDTSQLQQFVKDDKGLQEVIDDSQPPSFAGPQRTAIERIGGWVSFADKAGIVAGSVFVAISSLIIFNTIRMAIFNRREEIQMMKLIGAERSFIRGPFVVEAVVYGFIAAIIATGIGVGGLYATQDTLTSNGIAVAGTVNTVIIYLPFVLLAMIVVGAIIGVVSSLLATRRYLKI
ncbi:MAG TPA: permease-like cell division protein FtsX [Candidatus Saccharibacteria bacterium]|nr:permease-like cell division protein FtsX [Candidatus Saccharibacteria bacterium]